MQMLNNIRLRTLARTLPRRGICYLSVIPKACYSATGGNYLILIAFVFVNFKLDIAHCLHIVYLTIASRIFLGIEATLTSWCFRDSSYPLSSFY